MGVSGLDKHLWEINYNGISRLKSNLTLDTSNIIFFHSDKIGIRKGYNRLKNKADYLKYL